MSQHADFQKRNGSGTHDVLKLYGKVQQGLTELVFVVDESGSMYDLAKDTVGGFSSMLRKNREADGKANVSAVFFSDGTRVALDRVPIEDARPLNRCDYEPGGSTALLDALGGAISHTAKVQSYQPDGFRAEHVVFVAITDGYENASHRYAYVRVKWMIASAKKCLRQFNGTDNPEEQHKIAEELLGDMGARAVLMAPFRCTYGVHISFGDDVLVNMNCTFLDSNLITIGDRTLIAPDVKIYCGEHNMDASKRFGTRADGTRYLITTTRPVTIGKDCWIDGNATILPGVTIGDNVVVAAGAVVTKGLPSNTVRGGVPARVLRELQSRNYRLCQARWRRRNGYHSQSEVYGKRRQRKEVCRGDGSVGCGRCHLCLSGQSPL